MLIIDFQHFIPAQVGETLLIHLRSGGQTDTCKKLYFPDVVIWFYKLADSLLLVSQEVMDLSSITSSFLANIDLRGMKSDPIIGLNIFP